MSTIILFQIIFILFSLAAIISIFTKRRDGSLTIRGALMWFSLWVAADVVVIVPQSTTIIANHFGIGRGSDFVLYIAIGLIFFILFRLQVKLEQMNREVTKVIRKDALNRIK